MTETYRNFVHYLGLLDESEERNRLLSTWIRGDRKPVNETFVLDNGLPLEQLALEDLSGMANLALYDEDSRTGFSIIHKGGDNFHRAVDFVRDGFSRPKLRRNGRVQAALNGPENLVARVLVSHIAHLAGEERARQLVKVDGNKVVVDNQFELILNEGRDIHGELRLKK